MCSSSSSSSSSSSKSMYITCIVKVERKGGLINNTYR